MLCFKELPCDKGFYTKINARACPVLLRQVLISHRLDEVFRIADRVSVLRDGRYVGTVSTAHANKQQLITMMVNRPIGDEYPKVVRPIGEERLRAQSLRRGQAVKDISFCVHSGEVLGLAGAGRRGRTEGAALNLWRRRHGGRRGLSKREARTPAQSSERYRKRDRPCAGGSQSAGADPWDGRVRKFFDRRYQQVYPTRIYQ